MNEVVKYNKDKMQSTFWIEIIGTVTIIGSCFVFFKSLSQRKFRSTNGKLVKKEVGLTKQAVATGPLPRYEVFVEYHYTVESKQYAGHELAFSHRLMSHEAAKKLASCIPIHPKIYYNPKKPSQAVLLLDSLWLPLFASFIGIIFLFVGLSLES